MSDKPPPRRIVPGALLPGLVLLFAVFLGYALLVLVNAMILYPLVALTLCLKTAQDARAWITALAFVLALGEIIAFEVIRARRRKAPAGENRSGHPQNGVTGDHLLKKQT